MLVEGDATTTTRQRARRDWPLYCWYAVFIVLYAVYPKSGMGPRSTIEWYDQSIFLKALTDTIATGSSDLFAGGFVGPGYISLAKILHDLMGLAPDASLILLAKISFITTGVVMLTFVNRSTAAIPTIYRSGLMAITVRALFTSSWAYTTDIPWTHFTETALIATLALLIQNSKPAINQVLIGIVTVFAFQTRAYEGAVVLVALAIVAFGWSILRIITTGRLELRRAVGLAGFVVVGAAVAEGVIWATTRVVLPFVQYKNDAGTAKLVWSLLPTKTMQLFVDTCFSAICDSAATKPVSILGFPDQLNIWWQPLSLQLPALVAAALVVALLLVFTGGARRALPRADILFALLTAGGVLLAYTAAAPSGSPHLRYGFSREYLLPMVLLVMAAAALASAGKPRVIASTIGGLVLVVLALMGLRPLAANALPQYELSKAAYAADCGPANCSFAISAYNRLGQPVAISPLTIYAKQCGDQLTQGVADLDQVAYDPRTCRSIELVPAVTGLAETPNPTQYLTEPPVPGAQGRAAQR